MDNDRTFLLGRDPIIPKVCEDPGVSGLVSVIIPTYNRGYILEKIINSVISQTYKDIELIIVDDGSTDNTRQIVAKYKSQIKYIYQDNAGIASARNTGLNAASGEFIAFQDSDDILLPWKIEAQIEVMRNIADIALVWTDMFAINPDGDKVSDAYLRTMYTVYDRIKIEDHLCNTRKLDSLWSNCPDELKNKCVLYGDIFSAMFMGSLVHPPTALFRRDSVAKVGGLDITLSWTCEDYEFLWRICSQGMAALIDTASILYRIEAGDQLTSPQLNLYIARGNLITLKRYLKKEKSVKLSDEVKKKHLSEAYEWLSDQEARSENGKKLDAFIYLIKSILLCPIKIINIFKVLPFLILPKKVIGQVRTIKNIFRKDNK